VGWRWLDETAKSVRGLMVKACCGFRFQVGLLAGLILLSQSHQAVQGRKLIVNSKARVPIAGSTGHPIKTVNAIAATPNRVVLVEGETNSVLVLSNDGKILSRTPNTGAGGAMLGNPVQVVAGDAGEFLVLDAQTPRLARFSIQGDSLSLSSVLRLRTITGVSGACRLGGRLTVLGRFTQDPSNTKIAHVIRDDGDVISSFGDAFGSSDEFARVLFGAGRLLCVPRERLVIATSQHYPEVRAYDEHGILKWTRRISDYRALSYKESQPGRMEFVFPPDGRWDSTVSMFQPGDGIIAVQVGRRAGQAPTTPFESLRTVLLSVKDGQPLGEQNDLPLIKAATSDRLLAVDAGGDVWFLSHSLKGQ
jgi:hypothetical protein